MPAIKARRSDDGRRWSRWVKAFHAFVQRYTKGSYYHTHKSDFKVSDDVMDLLAVDGYNVEEFRPRAVLTRFEDIKAHVEEMEGDDQDDGPSFDDLRSDVIRVDREEDHPSMITFDNNNRASIVRIRISASSNYHPPLAAFDAVREEIAKTGKYVALGRFVKPLALYALINGGRLGMEDLAWADAKALYHIGEQSYKRLCHPWLPIRSNVQSIAMRKHYMKLEKAHQRVREQRLVADGYLPVEREDFNNQITWFSCDGSVLAEPRIPLPPQALASFYENMTLNINPARMALAQEASVYTKKKPRTKKACDLRKLVLERNATLHFCAPSDGGGSLGEPSDRQERGGMQAFKRKTCDDDAEHAVRAKRRKLDKEIRKQNPKPRPFATKIPSKKDTPLVGSCAPLQPTFNAFRIHARVFEMPPADTEANRSIHRHTSERLPITHHIQNPFIGNRAS